MTTSPYDSYRPPEPSRRRRRRQDRGGARRKGRRQDDGAGGSREAPMVEEAEFSSYYGRSVVKPPPWGDEIAAYLFLGGLAGGSSLLSAGAHLTGRKVLRRNARLTTIGALGLGTAALVHDLGRPERFLYMLRTLKPTSPMSVGTWILTGLGAGAGVTAAVEMDRLAGQRLPLGPLRPVLYALETPAEAQTAILAGPLSSYTAVLLSDTAVPTWNASREDLPFVFVSSASLAAAGMAMVTTPSRETAPARILAGLGALGDVIAMKRMKARMHPAESEPLEDGAPGHMLEWAERCAVVGGAGAVLLGRWRPAAAASGLLLVSASALTRLGILKAGLDSAKDPRHTVEPQRDRLEQRRAAGVVDDAITTTG